MNDQGNQATWHIKNKLSLSLHLHYFFLNQAILIGCLDLLQPCKWYLFL